MGTSLMGEVSNGVIRKLEVTKSMPTLDWIGTQMEALKAKYFRSHPDEPIIFHRKEMVNAKLPFECLKDPEIQKIFDRELLALMDSWEDIVITVCLDKKKRKFKWPGVRR